MKRVFVSFIITTVIIIGISSCGGNKNACYEITETGYGLSTISYFWGTQSDVEATVKAIQNSGATVTYKQVSKAKSECVGLAF